MQTNMVVGHYLALVQNAYAQKGALSGQRDALKTTTAKRIRDRMVSDIRRGAVLPPVVLGAVVSQEVFEKYPMGDTATVDDAVPEEFLSQLSIIDGMQRTTALMEAAEVDSAVREKVMRVEFWLTKTVSAMVYRMLVLNTGQVPWSLSRQLSVIYAPLLAEVQSRVPNIGRIHTPDKPGRRVAAGEYASDALVELYIAFNLRKTTVDTKEALSDEFSRLDFVENVSDERFQSHFYNALIMLVDMDRVFSLYEGTNAGRLSKGRNIFDGQPSRIGFIAAVAQYVIGRPGMDRAVNEREMRMQQLIEQSAAFTDRLSRFSPPQLGDFLRLEVLSETLDKRVGQVGRYERSLFFEAFQVLISERFEVSSLEPCWRAL
ncbi:hypothetical protein [Agrobacterium tumefaciens]|uniref:hypothetical protein n=1 Tax=Agrobacterium tumefaciens TaxID=358 RepID=UPI001574A384|nr:hypothetical protein [Agrobacterium tumefaciens]NTA51455.1 hypothetical protein [Agrobacterium tumefaciens]QNP82972.1 hypothetical protein IAI05_24035 [Agrobacterium tumefaciens]